MTALALVSLLAVAAPQTRFTTSKDGTRIAYDLTGSGPAVVLLHGGGQTRGVWHDAGYVARLAAEFTVITVDLRGNGESDKPSTVEAYAIDRLVEDVLAIADAAGARRFALWGFSYGANIGRYVAARSDRVAAMVYIGIPFGPAADGVFRRAILDTHGKVPWLTAMLDYPSIEPSDMRCPTLWVAGTANNGAMASVQAYKDKLEGTRVTLVTLDGLTHPQELQDIEHAFPPEVEFTRRHR